MTDKKKAVWITGSSSGIGRALSIEFAKNGVFVLGTARRKSLLDELKSSLGEFSENFEGHQLNHSSFDSLIEFHNEISSKFQIDCLINNAGTTSFKNAVDDSIEEIEKIIQVNLLGSIYAIKTVLPEMIDKKSGTIINILSVVTRKIFIASSAYSASKAGLYAYTNVLREEVRDQNIRVINVSPGATATNIWPEGTLKKYSDRMMSVENIANLIFRIYSEKSNMVIEELIIRPIKGDL
ncbi:MAG: SDR family NAD(P)-dependent oxidoreductase [Ignavibacteriales bacterium]|nr:SDR family NAD(P)-dependent oxidoreductase [Ignavibacteriales bacterium]